MTVRLHKPCAVVLVRLLIKFRSNTLPLVYGQSSHWLHGHWLWRVLWVTLHVVRHLYLRGHLERILSLILLWATVMWLLTIHMGVLVQMTEDHSLWMSQRLRKLSSLTVYRIRTDRVPTCHGTLLGLFWHVLCSRYIGRCATNTLLLRVMQYVSYCMCF